ncbi:DUF1576 domain-containing protein [Fusobacterium canifelinum]|uniref:DUF1576 domain-containing protein n=2 Tax=Fusobacterium canifelinum TaxID=285729 RepID=A0A7T9R1N0_9FUSO|nr:DUF1576 domain-containing protein [Fusobacterium canifelinum]QQB73455.1 DUF1576 domain-containing protein [Fusobacterium canifelinum]QQS86963.1 DUF1576 domain-containing protein [Fusobacterium canifelinum]
MDKITQRMKEIEILTVALSMLILIFFISYVINEHENIFIGMYKIITSPAVLVTDFMQVGGIGAAFLNAILIFSFNFFLVKSFKVKINGITIAAFFTVFGFSFFGKNILNILPFYLGGILYSIYTSTDFSEHIIPIAFSSALAPFVSSVAFYGDISYETSYINAILIGVLIGFIVVPLARSLFDFHEGYDLYNLGFTAGILGSVIIAVLKLYHFEITPQFLLSTEYDIPLKILCSAAFISLIIIGFYINDNSLSGYFSLIRDDGYKSDFTQKYGYGLTFINMGIMGFISMGFVIITGQTFNGPVLAGIFTVVGFSANGKTVFNTIPILIGVLLASLGSKGSIFTLAISGLFGTALAPISGVFGPIAGIIAGWLHLAVVQNVGLVHGGLNLYNNGFSAGIVAGFLLPIFNMITDNNNQRKMNIQRKHMNFLKNVQANIKKRMNENEEKK